jgi:hypothetical protein
VGTPGGSLQKLIFFFLKYILPMQAAKTTLVASLIASIENPPANASNKELRDLLAVSNALINLSLANKPAAGPRHAPKQRRRPQQQRKVNILDRPLSNPKVTTRRVTRPKKNGKDIVTLRDGTKEYYFDGVLSRGNDKPAIVYANGDLEWWANGERHRDSEPAVIYTNGVRKWYHEGELIHHTNGEQSRESTCERTGESSSSEDSE